jgi:metal-dependent amidase/aminoacylase/carboxypeptidase family protein
MINLSKKVAEDVIGKEVKFDETPSMGGEDFSFYLEKLRGKEIPGTFVMVGAANPQKGIPKCSHHQPDFQIDEEVIPEVSALHVKSVLEAIKYFKEIKEKK